MDKGILRPTALHQNARKPGCNMALPPTEGPQSSPHLCGPQFPQRSRQEGSGATEECGFSSEKLVLGPLALGQFLPLVLHPGFTGAGQVADD